ncbi:unnamed protein product, partial [Hapterophycus canaliculatus]
VESTGEEAASTSGEAEGGCGGETMAEAKRGETGGGDNNDGDDGDHASGVDHGTVLEEVRHQVAQEYLPVMRTIRDELIAELKSIDKSEVEDNRFSVSIHYRNCAHDDVPKVRDVVERVQKRHERIRMGSGKKV